MKTSMLSRNTKIALLVALFAVSSAPHASGEVTVRARITKVEPEARVRIMWTWGGRGQTAGDPVNGEFTEVPLSKMESPKPIAGGQLSLGTDELDALLGATGEKDGYLVEKGKSSDYHWLLPGVWSPAVPLSSFRNNGLKYLTVAARGCSLGDHRKPVKLKSVVFEFEILEDGQSRKVFSEAGADGPVATIILPVRALNANPSDLATLYRACGLSEYTRRLREMMEALPWAEDRLPERYEIMTDCGGYGTELYARTSNRAVFDDEFRILRQMGINGLRGKPSFFDGYIRDGRPEALALAKAAIGRVEGYPYIPAPWNRNSKRFRPLPWEEGAGCLYHPVYSNRTTQAQVQVAKALKSSEGLPFETCWLLSIDEIGDAFGGTAEGRSHMGVCPYCIAKFRDYLRGHGLTPADFDEKSWDAIRPTFGYFSKSHAERVREAERQRRENAAHLPDTVDPRVIKMEEDIDELMGEVVESAEPDVPTGPAAVEADLPISPRGWHKLTYWSRRFLNDGSVMLFTPMRDAFAAANAAKHNALADGKSDSPAARQPWLFTYALRGNTFLMGGQSIDFFDFYRYADTGFMYETSNRDPRVWSWDSYLCDVGRMLHDKLGLAFGIYIKPHRGAGMQRALSAVARSSRTLYWYTYGPEWTKGDSFGGSTNTMAIVSQTARLIGEAEPVTWSGRWTFPAEVAVVRPRTSEFFGNSAQWEDGKWVYTALQQAHLPMDPLDEEWLMSEDLSQYKAIYVTGSHIRREVAMRLTEYVRDGGSLFTGCGGLYRDEAGEVIEELLPVFGVQSRSDPELWGRVPRYGATALGAVSAISNAPANAIVKLADGSTFGLQVGWEKFRVEPGAELLATFNDGSPAFVRNRFGKGNAYLAAWYTGVEYATSVMKEGYNTAIDFPSSQRSIIAMPAVVAGAKPVVDASSPAVEGVRMINPETGREAVVLMNWGRNGHNLVGIENLSVRIRDAGAWKGARSVSQRRSVPARREGADLVIELRELNNGDVLLLE